MIFTSDDDFYDSIDFWDLPDCAVALLGRAGAWSARNGHDGFVPGSMVARFTSDPDGALAALLDRRLWGVAEGGYQFANWATWLAPLAPGTTGIPDADIAATTAMHRASAARRQALHRNPGLRHAIRARDCDRCRYCGIQVVWDGGRLPQSGTYDHVDPEGPNTFENLVVACRSCNSSKQRRTPRQAHMVLLDPPGTKKRGRPAKVKAEGAIPGAA